MCKVDDFRRMSLTSVAYKTMCSMVHRRLGGGKKLGYVQS